MPEDLPAHVWVCPNGHRFVIASKGPSEHRSDKELLELDAVIRVLGRGCSICGKPVRYEVKHAE